MVLRFKTGEEPTDVYFRGNYTKYSSFFLTFVSKYNNKTIGNNRLFNGTNRLETSVVEKNSEWIHLTLNVGNIGNTEDFLTDDIGGYYDVILLGTNNNITFDELKRQLCRIETDFTDKEDITFISNNENNEQFTYYNE